MHEVEGIDVMISKENMICDECYKKHNRLLHMGDTHEINLHDAMYDLKSTIAMLESAEILTEYEYINGIASLTAFELAKKLLADEAILLPDLYSDTFSELAMKHKNKVKNYTLPGARWLLTYLSNALQDSLGIATKHKRYGTLLYQTNGDTLHALSKALGELKSSQKSTSSIRKQMDESIYKSQLQAQEAVSTDTIISVCKYLNGVINSNIKKIIEQYQCNPYLYSEFTFKGFSESIDEILTKVVSVLTQPTRSRRNLSLDGEKDNLAFCKQMYCLLVLFFCTNNKCHPLHYTLTDSIINHHGSNVLVKILIELELVYLLIHMTELQMKLLVLG